MGEDVVLVQNQNRLEIFLNGNCCVENLLRCHLRDLRVVLLAIAIYCHEFSRSLVLTYINHRSKIEILSKLSLLLYPVS